jgi:flagellar secretion chaperone FliS
MSTDLRQNYMEDDVLEAGGCRLVILLYENALTAVQQAQVHLQKGDIRERSRMITRASEILNELALSVDHDAGGEISKNLVELYEYLQSLLLKANSEQIGEPLTEAASLIEPLLEAWRSCDLEAAEATSTQDVLTVAASEEYAPVNCVG